MARHFEKSIPQHFTLFFFRPYLSPTVIQQQVLQSDWADWADWVLYLRCGRCSCDFRWDPRIHRQQSLQCTWDLSDLCRFVGPETC